MPESSRSNLTSEVAYCLDTEWIKAPGKVGVSLPTQAQTQAQSTCPSRALRVDITTPPAGS